MTHDGQSTAFDMTHDDDDASWSTHGGKAQGGPDQEYLDRIGYHWPPSLVRLIRIAELRRVIDGDMGFARFRTGHLQGIEGDRVRTPKKLKDDSDWRQVVLVG